MKENLDAKIIKALGDDDGKVFEVFMAENREAVYRLLRKFPITAKDATDMTSDIFTKLWLKRKKIDDTKPLKPLLMTIARNKGIDLIRKRINRKVLHEKYKKVLETSYSIRELLDVKELDAMLHKAIGSISAPQCRQVAYYSLVNQMNVKEIAAALDIKPRVVSNQLSAGKKIIRAIIRKYIDA